MARSAGVLAKPEDGYSLPTLPTFTSSSKPRATGGEGTPIFSAATWRLTKLTSSHRLVCWQPVKKATANSSPWCSCSGGADIRLTHQGSSSWCAEVSSYFLHHFEVSSMARVLIAIDRTVISWHAVCVWKTNIKRIVIRNSVLHVMETLGLADRNRFPARCAHSHRPSGGRKIVIATTPSRR